jgi:holo-[acyl-carrier protein] synthase
MPVVGLGMDICSIDRIQRILDGPRAERFLERVYTEAERALCSSRQDAAAAFAARFAAKEALLKALGAPSGVRWREIEVVPTSGAPELRLSGVAEAELRRRNAFALLSISHDAGVAAAAVILEAGR